MQGNGWLRTLCRAHGKHLSLSLVEHVHHGGTEVVGHGHIDLIQYEKDSNEFFLFYN